MEKIERDGKVAVLYSPGFGAGWSTWADGEHREVLCMHPSIVQPVLDGDIAGAISAAKSLVPGMYTGGARNLTVAWLPKGAVFEVEEYDGSESLHIVGGRPYLTA